MPNQFCNDVCKEGMEGNCRPPFCELAYEIRKATAKAVIEVLDKELGRDWVSKTDGTRELWADVIQDSLIEPLGEIIA
jgi:hypothetical protein